MRCRQLGFAIAIAVALAGCGSSAPAEKSADEQVRAAMKLSDPAQRTGELLKAASRQQQLKDILGARSTLATAAEAARSIKAPASRATILCNVAAAYGRMGEKEQVKTLLKDAAAAVQEIPDASAKVTPLTTLATCISQYLDDGSGAAKHLQEAEQATQSISNPVIKTGALGRIAAAHSRLPSPNDADRVIDAAMAFARQCEAARVRADCLAEVGLALSRMQRDKPSGGAFDAARVAAKEIEADDSRGYALLGIAGKLAEAGQAEEARNVLAEARQVADGIKDQSVRDPLVQELEAARSNR